MPNKIVQEQLMFVEWLKSKGMYNRFESGSNMQKLHNLWKTILLDIAEQCGDCPETYGPEGPNTFSPCRECIVCLGLKLKENER